MKLPGRMLDLSVALDNDTVLDPPNMRPKIEYLSDSDNAWMLLESFPGLQARRTCRTARAGRSNWCSSPPTTAPTWTRPIHFNSHDDRRQAAMTIDQVPLDWFMRPGVKLDFRHLPDGHVVTAAEVEAELARIGHDAAAVRHRAGQYPRRRLHRQGRLHVAPAAAWGARRRCI